MNHKRKSFADAGLIPLAFLAFSFIAFVIAVLSVFVLCIDRINEFENGWGYQNTWEPFAGGYLDYIKQLPVALYTSFAYFPLACFLTVVFFPLLVIVMPVYDMFVLDIYIFFYVLTVPIALTGLFFGLAIFSMRWDQENA